MLNNLPEKNQTNKRARSKNISFTRIDNIFKEISYTGYNTTIFKTEQNSEILDNKNYF